MTEDEKKAFVEAVRPHFEAIRRHTAEASDLRRVFSLAVKASDGDIKDLEPLANLATSWKVAGDKEFEARLRYRAALPADEKHRTDVMGVVEGWGRHV